MDQVQEIRRLLARIRRKLEEMILADEAAVEQAQDSASGTSTVLVAAVDATAPRPELAAQQTTGQTLT